MTPPLSLLLALTWLSGASAFTPGTEHDYEVTGSVNVPGHGVFSFKMAVGLSVLPVEGDMTPLARSADPLSHPEATRTLRLDVERSRLYDATGASAPMPEMEAYPFFFHVGEGGAVVGVAHHPDEDERALGSKRTLAACHQLLLGPAPSATSAWPLPAAHTKMPPLPPRSPLPQETILRC